MSEKISFTTCETSSRLTDGKSCYQGQLIHNQVWGPEETRKRFAASMGVSEAQANLFIDSLGCFMAQAVAEGCRLNFGPFSVLLKLSGGFSAANAPYSSETNSIAVRLTPSATIKAAASKLQPVNITPEVISRIWTSEQCEPVQVMDTIERDGTRKLLIVGDWVRVNATAEDEGVWIETDAGLRLLTGVVTAAEVTTCRATFTGPATPGHHWLVVCSRREANGPLLRATRRITIR